MHQIVLLLASWQILDVGRAAERYQLRDPRLRASMANRGSFAAALFRTTTR
jgi:hypothetical protein